MPTLYTAGYQGRDIDAFVELLGDHGVDTLVDVRENPYSRKPGFTKGPLEEAAAEAGIDYLHVEALGNPSEIRKELDGTEEILAAYVDHMEGDWADALEPVRRLVEAGDQPCLMCYERSVDECHRGPVADALAERLEDLSVEHL